MAMEDDHIYDCFKRNFIDSRKGNIILYGTGIRTRFLLERLSSDVISGIMDIKKTGEEFFGYRVMSPEEVKKIPDVCIVIIARDSVINTVYRRIEEFCRDSGISAYDIAGNQLGEDHRERDEACFKLSIQELESKLKDADIVTFDVFDTLLMRRVYRERDVFELIGEEQDIVKGTFAKLRADAETEAWKKPHPDIYRIYEELKKLSSITDKDKERLLKTEVDTEKRVIVRREEVCRLFDKIKEMGKKVFLISDMYLTKDIIADILHENGISGYEGLFVSCEFGKGKQDGLYEAVLNIIDKEKQSRILHIGDNYYSDIEAASLAGFDTFQIYKCLEMFERGLYSEHLPEPHNIKESIILGMFVEYAYSDPFGEYGKDGRLKISQIGRVIKLFVAPVLTEFVFYLCKQIRSMDPDLVLFPARDGWVMRKMYRMLVSRLGVMPEDVYFYTSRRAALVAAAVNDKDIGAILSVEYFNDVKAKVLARFDITIGDDYEEEKEKYIEKLLGVCSDERRNYLKYLECLGDYENKTIALIDFVAIGTVQEALQRLINKKISGIYFLRRRPEDSRFADLNIQALYGTQNEYGESNNMYRFYYFLETVLSSPEPSLKKFDWYGSPVFYDESRTGEDLKNLKDAHNAICKYFENVIDVIPREEYFTDALGICDAMLGLLSEEWTDIDEREVFCSGNVDEFMGRTVSSMNR